MTKPQLKHHRKAIRAARLAHKAERIDRILARFWSDSRRQRVATRERLGP